MLNCKVNSIVRSLSEGAPESQFEVGCIDSNTDYTESLIGVDVVIHLAAQTQSFKDRTGNFIENIYETNVEGSVNLARQAAISGVRRFIFISSLKVLGESTTNMLPFNEQMKHSPSDAYAKSKSKAEIELELVLDKYQMELVIIRPPLVYGPGVRSNFLSLLNLSYSGLPLPFGCVENYRSMVYVANVVDFIIHCIDHPAAGNQTFLVSDGRDVSLKSLIAMIRRAMKRPVLLFPIPVTIFKLVGKITGKKAIIERLVGDLRVDDSKARKLLGWTPPYTVEQGIADTVKAFINKD